MFEPIMEQIQALAQDAWLFLIGLLIIVAMLGALYYRPARHRRRGLWRRADDLDRHPGRGRDRDPGSLCLPGAAAARRADPGPGPRAAVLA